MSYASKVWDEATKIAPRFGYRKTEDFLAYVEDCWNAAEKEDTIDFTTWEFLDVDGQLQVIRKMAELVNIKKPARSFTKDSNSAYNRKYG